MFTRWKQCFCMWVCNEDLRYVLNPRKDQKVQYRDRKFHFTSSTEIDMSINTYKDLKLGIIKLRTANGDVVIQRCHCCIILPKWLDPKYNPDTPHIRHLYFRVQVCPGNCEPCWGFWPPKIFECVNKDICGDWLCAEVDFSYQIIFFLPTNIFLFKWISMLQNLFAIFPIESMKWKYFQMLRCKLQYYCYVSEKKLVRTKVIVNLKIA